MGCGSAFGGAPALTSSLYTPGVDSARKLFLLVDGRGGYTVDAEGALHPVGSPPPIDNAPRWPGQDVARGVAGPGGGSVVVDPGEVVRAPVTGRVTRAGIYTLYCRYTDGFASSSPTIAPATR